MPQENNYKLDKLSVEFIMASKSHKPFDNVLSIFAKNYADTTIEKSLDALVEILSPIIQHLKDINLAKVLSELLPSNRWKGRLTGFQGDDLPINEVIVRYLISEMQTITKAKMFEEMEKQT